MAREIDFLGGPNELHYYSTTEKCQLCGALPPEGGWEEYSTSVVVIDGIEYWACEDCKDELADEKWQDYDKELDKK